MKLLFPLLALALLAACATTDPADLARARALGEAVNLDRPFAESAFVTSQGLKVHYRHWPAAGEAKGQVLLLHGFGSSTFTWRFLAPELAAAGYDVAAADIPPFGYSEKDAAKFAPPADRGELLWAVPDALGWRGKIVLVGHSMGGLYATTMGLAHPERLKALVLMAGAVPTDGKPAAGAPFFAGLLTPFLEGSLRSWKGVKDMLQGFVVKGEVVPDALVDGYVAPYQVPGGVQALIAWSTAGGQGAVHPETLRVPTLLLWGEADSIVPPETGRKLAALIPGSRLVLLPGRGHLAHELQSGEVNPLVLGFLGEVNP